MSNTNTVNPQNIQNPIIDVNIENLNKIQNNIQELQNKITSIQESPNTSQNFSLPDLKSFKEDIKML